MRSLALSSLCAPFDSIQGGQLADDVLIEDIVIDSRRARAGVLFVALKGASSDGHDYLERAIEQGVSAVLVDQNHPWTKANESREDVMVLRTPHPRAVLGQLASEFFGHPSHALHVVGVTGTNGKTTCTYMLEHILSRAGRKVGVIGTVNYRWPGHILAAPNTTPESLFTHRLMARMLDEGVDTVLLEVSSHGLCTHRVKGVAFDVAMFTNFTQDHLDFHASMDAYYQAKVSLFTTVLKGSFKQPLHAVINLDDPTSSRLLTDIQHAWGEDDRLTIHTTSLHQDVQATCSIDEVRPDIDGTSFVFGGHTIKVPMLGDFNLSNALESLAAATALGLDITTLGFDPTWPGVPGRLQRVHVSRRAMGRNPAVFVDYAHTPDALERSCEALRPLAEGKLWCVFGCGGDRDHAKRPLMGQAALTHADHVILTSDNPRSEDPTRIIQDITQGLGQGAEHVLTFVDRARAIEYAIDTALDADVILIAGKGHEAYQEINGKRIDFDDAVHAAHWLELGPRPIVPVGDIMRPRFVTDSRQAGPGDVFVALNGERFDAHTFVPQVVEAGAHALVERLVEGVPESGQTVVPNTLKSLQAYASHAWVGVYLEDSIKTIALTGSNGKTTTKELLRAMWSTSNRLVHATSGNFNNHIGVPLTLFGLRRDHDVAIIEMGANAPGDIGELIQIAPANVRIITSIGEAHLEGFGGLDGVRRTKSEIFNDVHDYFFKLRDAIAIVPHHERAALIPEGFPGRILTFGPEPQADVCVTQVDATEHGSRVMLTYKEQSWTLSMGLVGPHNATNLAAAFASFVAYDSIPTEDVLNQALKQLHVPGGRWRESHEGDFHWVDDAYNANPASVRASVEAFVQWNRAQSLSMPHTVVVVGEMLEMGPQSESLHMQVAREIAQHADLTHVLCVGTFADTMTLAAQACAHDSTTVLSCQTPEDAAGILRELGSGRVFLKASRGARLERVIELVHDGPPA